MGKDTRARSDPFEPAGTSPAGECVNQRTYRTGETIFAQGDPCMGVMYVSDGLVRLSVVSHAGKQAIFGLLTTGAFFGEACLAGQTQRMATATAMSNCTITTIQVQQMKRQLKSDPALADHFFADMVDRHIRLEEDLIDQLFNSTEKRLARTLLLLVRVAHSESAPWRMPRVSQECLAEMIGSTRPRVNFFMNKFRRLGHIQYDHQGLSIRQSLTTIVMRD